MHAHARAPQRARSNDVVRAVAPHWVLVFHDGFRLDQWTPDMLPGTVYTRTHAHTHTHTHTHMLPGTVGAVRRAPTRTHVRARARACVCERACAPPAARVLFTRCGRLFPSPLRACVRVCACAHRAPARKLTQRNARVVRSVAGPQNLTALDTHKYARPAACGPVGEPRVACCASRAA